MKAMVLEILELASIGQGTCFYNSSASWFISQLMNRESDPANGQILRNSTKTSWECKLSMQDMEERSYFVSAVRIEYTCNDGCNAAMILPEI